MASPKHAADRPAHQHGTMDISHHQKTFAGFLRALTWVVAVVFGILIFLALANS
jgi:preprotein translocase subunit SecG